MENNYEYEDIINEIRNIDSSIYAVNKEQTLEKLLAKIEKDENSKVNGSIYQRMRKPSFVLVAVLMMLLCTIAVFGQDIVRITKQVFLGDYASFTSDIDKNEIDFSIPEEFAGELFSEEGIMLEEFPQDFDDYIKVYDEEGEQLLLYNDSDDSEFVTKDEFLDKTLERRASMTTTFNTLEEAEYYFSYKYLKPTYLPEGFYFDSAEIYNNDDGVPEQNSKYIDIYYSNGDLKLRMSVMFTDEETAYTGSGLGELTELDINGHHAVATGNHRLSLEIDGILYTFNGIDENHNFGIGRDELILMAESLIN